MKNIVICCDGTGNEYGRHNTNVVETYVLAEKDAAQTAYYDPGVGNRRLGIRRSEQQPEVPVRPGDRLRVAKRTSRMPTAT